MADRQLHVNVNVLSLGSHPAAWRVSPAGPRGYLERGYFEKLAQIAERGLLDAFFLADALTVTADPSAAPSWALDPALVAVAMAGVTEQIGFIITASTTFEEPYALARRFASLDHLTGGRVGWNVVTTYDEPAALNFGLDQLPERDDRYGRADEFVEVVLKLWDSWEDGAMLGDAEAGRFAERGRIHAIDHEGLRFRVRGPLQVPRSPQGRLLLVQAGASEQGRALAARHADAVFASQLSIRGARAYYDDVKRRAAALGRAADDIAILPGLSLVIGGTEAEARQRKLRLDAMVGGDDAGLQRFARRLGIDPDALDLDKPVPVELLGNARRATGTHGFADATVALIVDEQPTVRELIHQGGGGHRLVVGAPEQVADAIEEWFTTGAADGFNVMFDVFPSGLEAFVDHVVPELQRRGIYRREYDGRLLRERYGLSRPASVFANAAHSDRALHEVRR